MSADEPRTDKRRVRPNVLGARLTYGEYRLCREAAERSGLSVSEWARHALVGAATGSDQ